MAVTTRDAIQAQAKAKFEAAKASRTNQGTVRGSNEQVNRLSKKQSRNVMNGGKTSYNSSVGPSGASPDPVVQDVPVTPDYFRNGHMIAKEIVDPFTGESRTTQLWAPIPELIGERSKPTPASIKLVDVSNINNTDPNNPKPKQLIPEYTKFFLQGVQEAEREKVQIVETFNDFYTFFYGKKPPVYTFSGYLLNLVNYNWWNEFMYYYENFWRGTKAVEKNARIFLTYNYQQVQGYLLNVNANVNAMTDKGAPFSVSLLVTRRLIFSGSPSDGYISDSLLPKSDTGLINTNADGVAVKLTTEYLSGNAPADDNQILDGSNREEGNRVYEEASDSSPVDQFLNFSKPSGVSSGSFNASSLKSGLGFLA